MQRVVSQAELDTILAPELGSGNAVVAYDFRRPDRVSAQQLRAVHLLHETFANDSGTWMSAFLRTTTELRLVDVDQLSYADFLSSLPESTAAYALAMAPLDAFLTLTISPDVAFTMVDRILGGLGTAAAPERPLTEIEQNVVDSVVKLLIDQLTRVWRGVGAQFTIHARDTRPVMLQVTRPNDVVAVLSFTLKVADTRGTLRLCIPATVFDRVGDAFAKAPPDAPRQRTDEQSAWLEANLARVPLAITAQLATTLAARDLVDLAPGVVLSLGHQSHQPVTVNVGDVPAFVGHVVVHNGSLAIRVDDGTPEQPESTQE
jgi:flagellar motor switch protein FliM